MGQAQRGVVAGRKTGMHEAKPAIGANRSRSVPSRPCELTGGSDGPVHQRLHVCGAFLRIAPQILSYRPRINPQILGNILRARMIQRDPACVY